MFGMPLPRSTPILAALALLTATGCGTDSALTVPDPVPADELEQILSTAIQDEFHAEAVYAGVIDDFGSITPFSNIIRAEVRHSAAIARLYENRGWSVPQSAWTPATVPHFGTVSEACSVGVEAEIANIQVYDDLLAGADLPADVVRVFTSNRAASLNNHLPAFERCSG
ncbi:MAG: DUF2202 domain-containing protein [Gemmatimonadetes bacterium]|nr:DUF2202 domain-containing protein [Gemmatimonadota bacterium]MBT8404874.1 DUF2202 domain-containing protein [Gemmatimonadota bacterium]NNF37799.1 DUF2202 domain-containing protein [Gemmatimonadota bacterium]NNK62239.1 DUF2202 domain-containing protein [Gemmatimonadota bacterium]